MTCTNTETTLTYWEPNHCLHLDRPILDNVGDNALKAWAGRTSPELNNHLLVGKIAAGFVSIDCGGGPSTNSITTISWAGDSQYTSTGSNGNVVFPWSSSADNADALATFRYFPGNRRKYCYDLPTAGGNVSFLLRAMFLHGYATELALPIQFDVAVNGSTWFTIDYPTDSSYDTLTTAIEYEGIFYASGTVTHFCLVTRTGLPFISSLELRPLDRDGNMYSLNTTFADNGVYLSTLERVNCGALQGSANVRLAFILRTMVGTMVGFSPFCLNQ